MATGFPPLLKKFSKTLFEGTFEMALLSWNDVGNKWKFWVTFVTFFTVHVILRLKLKSTFVQQMLFMYTDIIIGQCFYNVVALDSDMIS